MNANWRVALNLAKELNKDATGLLQDTEDIEKDFLRLKNTFKDDEIKDIEMRLNKIKSVVNDNGSYITAVSEALMEFAVELQKTARETS